MKKYFIFLLVIISAEHVAAQQTKRPSFRDFMNKTNDFANGSEKSIAVIPENNISSRMYSPKPTKRFRFRPGHDLSNLKRNFTLPETNNALARLSHVLPNGNKVYILPQDNMPCIVPDTRGYNMPVGWGNVNSDEGIYATPPLRVIPAPDKTSLPQQQTTGKK